MAKTPRQKRPPPILRRNDPKIKRILHLTRPGQLRHHQLSGAGGPAAPLRPLQESPGRLGRLQMYRNFHKAIDFDGSGEL